MKVEILGTGCYKCLRLESLLNEVVEELGKASFEVLRISDERKIRRHLPVDEIPGLLIDGVLVSSGEIPSREQLIEWLSSVRVTG